MTVTTEDGGRTNVYAKEPQMKVMDVTVTHNEKAEMLNGRLAMLGVIAAIGAYTVTGQLIPGVFWLVQRLLLWTCSWIKFVLLVISYNLISAT